MLEEEACKPYEKYNKGTSHNIWYYMCMSSKDEFSENDQVNEIKKAEKELKLILGLIKDNLRKN